MKPAEALKKAREASGLTQADLAARLHVTEKTIRNWEHSRTGMSVSKMLQIAHAFKCSTWEEFLAKHVGQRPFSQQVGDGVPLFEAVPAGNGDFDPTELGEDNGFSGVMLDRGLFQVTDPMAFAVVVKGDSMMPTFAEGEIVICSPSADHEPGMVAVYRHEDGSCGLKVIESGSSDDTIRLVSLNPRYATREVDRSAVTRLAKVVAKTTIF